MSKFWNVTRNDLTSEGEIRIYGEIAEVSWWDTIGSKQFNEDLDKISDVNTLIIRINSPGGEVFAGIAIYNSIKHHKAVNKKIYIDGIAASIASVIAMAGTEIIMAVNSLMMIHNPSSIVWGTADEMRTRADALDKMRDSLVATYQERTNLSSEEIIEMLNNETWLNAEEALEKGFITTIDKKSVDGEIKNKMLMINGVNYDIKKYNKFPVTSFLNFNNVNIEKNKEEEIVNMSQNNNQGDTLKPMEITADIIKNSYPDIYSAIYNAAIESERSRMLGIDEIAETTENKELIVNAKKEGKTKEQLAFDIVTYRNGLGKEELEKMKNDSKVIEKIDPVAETKTEEVEAKATGLAALLNKGRGGN